MQEPGYRRILDPSVTLSRSEINDAQSVAQSNETPSPFLLFVVVVAWVFTQWKKELKEQSDRVRLTLVTALLTASCHCP